MKKKRVETFRYPVGRTYIDSVPKSIGGLAQLVKCSALWASGSEPPVSDVV